MEMGSVKFKAAIREDQANPFTPIGFHRTVIGGRAANDRVSIVETITVRVPLVPKRDQFPIDCWPCRILHDKQPIPAMINMVRGVKMAMIKIIAGIFSHPFIGVGFAGNL